MTIHTIDLLFQQTPKTIAAFLIETDGQLALVETGPYSTFPVLKAGIERLGYAVEDIQQVFITHIHFDHAGASWAFAENGATIHLHPFGYPHMKDPSRLVSSAKRIYQDQMDTLWGPLKAIDKDRLRVVEHGEEFKVGSKTMTAWFTPGHAYHHIAWQFDKEIIFAGDVAGVKIDSGIVVPPCPPPDINIEDWQNSINLIKRLNPTQLYLTHFGPVEQITSHLHKLEAILLDWAAWMKPHYEANRPVEQIVPEFEAYTLQQLREAGASKELLHSYNTANPVWMSVAGLMRYWKVKNKPKEE